MITPLIFWFGEVGKNKFLLKWSLEYHDLSHVFVKLLELLGALPPGPSEMPKPTLLMHVGATHCHRAERFVPPNVRNLPTPMTLHMHSHG